MLANPPFVGGKIPPAMFFGVGVSAFVNGILKEKLYLYNVPRAFSPEAFPLIQYLRNLVTRFASFRVKVENKLNRFYLFSWSWCQNNPVRAYTFAFAAFEYLF